MTRNSTGKGKRTVRAMCNMCRTRCSLECVIENGKVTKTYAMPRTNFNAHCARAEAIPELIYSPERLLKPLKKVNGKFKEITWEEALGIISAKLTDIKRKYGAGSFVAHLGYPFVGTHTQKVARRFCDLYGTPNYTTGAAFCFSAQLIGFSLVCGALPNPQPGPATRCMLVWGRNPDATDPLLGDTIHLARKNGSKLIVIDSRATPLAKEADIHAQIRPGADTALALGLLNIIIGEKLYDENFVNQWTVGFDKLAESVCEYSPERVEKITWVPAKTVRDIALMYAANRPACTVVGLSLEYCTNGIQSIRAATVLTAITGNIDVEGGNLIKKGLRQTNLRVPEKISQATAIGADYPIFSKFTTEAPASSLTEAILSSKPYSIKGLIIVGGNPVLTWPNAKRVIQALDKLDFLVVSDLFLTDTAKQADIVLPGASFLEKADLRDYNSQGMSRVTLYEKAIEPAGDCREEWLIWAELGRRMGLADYFPWETTDQLFEYLLKSTSVTLKQLKETPEGLYYAHDVYQKYLKEGFNTESGKIEIFSEMLARLGYEPLPRYLEPAESPVSRPDLAREYPLILTTGARILTYVHTMYRNLPSLRKLAPEPVVEIHPKTAGVLNIADRDMVKVETPRGNIKLKAALTEDILPEVVSVPHGWSEANVNYLTDDRSRDPVSGYPGSRSELCRVSKV
jgi:anaerobic selenocysteine-containing dehydrogenase